MRIENNNNLTFGAYFKNNTNFKKLLSVSYKPDEKLVDKFVHSCPDHEIEIIDMQMDSRQYIYRLFNNTLGNNIAVFSSLPFNYALQDILKKITDTPSSEYDLLFKKNSFTDFYKTITKQK